MDQPLVTHRLRNLSQVLVFGAAVAGLQYGFQPDQPFAPNLVHSLLVSVIIWAVIEFGRHVFPSSSVTGWPAPVPAALLVLAAIATGFVLGNMAARKVSLALGLYPAGAVDRGGPLRNSVLITLAAGTVATYYFFSRGRGRWLQRKAAEAERLAGEARLKLLETQLEPHMLFNTLASLRALIEVDAARAQQMLDHMVAYLRATLNASHQITHPLAAEFERLREYLALMAVRMGPRLDYDLNLPSDLAEQPVPTLLLQPLVENSIRHGLEPNIAGGRIEVRAWRDGDLVLEVQDTGVGLAASVRSADSTAQTVPGESQGFGLGQVRARLAALYGPRASLDLAPGAGGHGTLARVRIPLSTGDT
ncbi:MAG TPA: histidine kinase [Burkholderiales bacterium]|nr:histidine kinase [Burkholderiales bacterium]